MKEKKQHWILRYFLCCLAFTILYCGYLHFFMGVNISIKPDIQTNYAEYLVKMQDKMVEHSLDYITLTEETERMYSDEEKDAIKNELVEQNDLLKELQKNPPAQGNEDYIQIYNDIMKIFTFYIQGETMQADYIYAYKNYYLPDEENSDKSVRLETYTMGTALCNVMGNMMLNNYKYINQVRDTNFESKYNITPVEDLEGYLKGDDMDDEERRKILDEGFSSPDEVESVS